MKLAVSFHGPNDLSIPENWPKDIRELSDSAPIPGGFVEMTVSEYNAYIAANQANYDAAQMPYNLSIAKTSKLLELNLGIGNYIEAHYNQRQQSTLTALLIEATILGYTNRINYIAQALNWVKQVIKEYYIIRTTVNECETIEELVSIHLNLSSYDATDPLVIIESALDINN